ncbi:PH domain-containing protein [Hymenobacter koreensis]|uniref:Uncharacterized protein YyaB-like PH domain-containing protein n=1 Tax=Hymenobacter koreensis TaxID=1084523 RepID=A0ABP8J1L5_9BACT
MATQVFPAKVSWWLFGPILAIITVSAGFNLYYGAPVGALVSLGAAAFMAYIVLGTRYTLTDGVLNIASGPFSWRVPVDSISRVQPTNNPLSSPAPSLDRLAINYNKYDTIMVSPRDKAAFVAALQQLNPTIQLS